MFKNVISPLILSLDKKSFQQDLDKKTNSRQSVPLVHQTPLG